MSKAPKKKEAMPNIPVYKVVFDITSAVATLSVSGDFHFGVRGVYEEEIVEELTKCKKDVFRIFTGDNSENSLKTSVGHNYDVMIPDPTDQKDGAIRILTRVMKYQIGSKNWSSYKAPTEENHVNAKAVGVGGNHEYRTRKLTGQWLDKEIYNAAKILPMGMEGIVELTLRNKKLKLSKTYRIYVSHAPGKANTSATSNEAILRGFRKKQSSLPGIDIFAFGHFHKRFLQSDGYFDSINNKFRKVLYVINPSLLTQSEYAIEAGYPLLEKGYSIEVYLPIDEDEQPYGII